MPAVPSAPRTVTVDADAPTLAALLDGTRRLLRIDDAADARRIAIDVVRELGGDVVLARAAGPDAIPLDLSFGEGEPVLPAAPLVSVARVLLERHLPGFVEDAARAVALARSVERLASDASLDPLTGLANRRGIGRLLGRLNLGDAVVMLDLDHFKRLNDSEGHEAGDRVLRAFGAALRHEVRSRDTAGRYGGEEFVVVLAGTSVADVTADDADHFLTRLRRRWMESRPAAVTFSAGVALVSGDPRRALAAADGALYRAKGAGRDRWTFAAAPELGGTDEERVDGR